MFPELIVERYIQGRVADIAAADHDAVEQRFAAGHPVVIIGAGTFFFRAALSYF